ncbi:hypothetical protein BH20ACT3_BH20ACT3_13850 [soil metagenome]
MRIVDLNLLIYATDDRTKHHPSAKAWLDGALGATGTIGLPTAFPGVRWRRPEPVS